jgi:hypothetical protein
MASLRAKTTSLSLHRQQPLPAEALGKGVFRFGKAEHHELAVIAVH